MNMKKIVLTLLALLTISLSACSQKKTDTKMEQKVLVAYFSATGIFLCYGYDQGRSPATGRSGWC